MTWALSEVAQLYAVCYAVRASLKKLKVLANGKTTDEVRKVDLISLEETLMFWVIFGIYMMFEQHLEIFVRWFPGYYYLKASFIIIVAYPKLQITKFVFYKGIVPSIEEVNRIVTDHGGLPSLQSIVWNLPYLILGLAFPPFTSHTDDSCSEDENPEKVIEDCIEIYEDIPSVFDTSSFALPRPAEKDDAHHQAVEAKSLGAPHASEDSTFFTKTSSPARRSSLTARLTPLTPPLTRCSSRPCRKSPATASNTGTTPTPNSTDSDTPSCQSSGSHRMPLSPKSPSSLAGLSVALQSRMLESSRRLSSLSQIINIASSNPVQLSNGSAGGRSGLSDEKDVGKENPVHRIHAEKTVFDSCLGGGNATNLPRSPGTFLSIRSMFSTDLHSPPVNSLQRINRRRSLMSIYNAPSSIAAAASSRKVSTPPSISSTSIAGHSQTLAGVTASGLSASEATMRSDNITEGAHVPSLGNLKALRSRAPQLQDAMLSGNVSLGRGRGRR